MLCFVIRERSNEEHFDRRGKVFHIFLFFFDEKNEIKKYSEQNVFDVSEYETFSCYQVS
jgi:hypothetical protein